MLIRSQDKSKIINVDNVSVIDFFSMNGVFAISVEALDASCSIAEYSTREKALKVLDMIQEAYGDSECTKFLIPEICNILRVAERTEENKEHARKIGEGLKDGMTFQMPEDNEVVV